MQSQEFEPRRLTCMGVVLVFVGALAMHPSTTWAFDTKDGEKQSETWVEWQWQKDHGYQKTAIITFEKSKITIRTGKKVEVWKILSGKNVVVGFDVEREGKRATAQGTVKFNEMIFRLGKRRWMLAMAGSRRRPGGSIPNAPDSCCR